MCAASVAVMGGTFNPIHNGHIQTALELQQRLQVDTLRLMPSARPPHREQPAQSDQQRIDMVELAIAAYPQLVIDCREFSRDGFSYTVDTLAVMRQELGDDCSLMFCAGMDSLVNLPAWSRWQSITDYAHLVIAARPGWSLDQISHSALQQWLAQRTVSSVEALHQTPAGKVMMVSLTPYDISSSAIRRGLQQGRDMADYVAPAVLQYIQQHRLYS